MRARVPDNPGPLHPPKHAGTSKQDTSEGTLRGPLPCCGHWPLSRPSRRLHGRGAQIQGTGTRPASSASPVQDLHARSPITVTAEQRRCGLCGILSPVRGCLRVPVLVQIHLDAAVPPLLKGRTSSLLPCELHMHASSSCTDMICASSLLLYTRSL